VTYQITLNNLAILLLEKEQKKEAKEKFKNALEILEPMSVKNPDNKKLNEELSLTREKLEVLEIEPDTPEQPS
jgi:hypothetical protein